MSKTTNKYSPEVRERAVRMVLDADSDKAAPLFRFDGAPYSSTTATTSAAYQPEGDGQPGSKIRSKPKK